MYIYIYILFFFLLITVALLMDLHIYCNLLKYEAKQKNLSPFYATSSKVKEVLY